MNHLLAAPTVQYCEAVLDQLIARPWYATSNAVFIIVGIIMLIQGGRHSKLFGVLALMVGTLSFIYDASYTYVSQLFDLAGMLILIGSLLYLNLSLLVKNRRNLVVSLLVALLAALVLIVAFRGFAGNVIFGALVVSYVVIEIYLVKTGKHKKPHQWIIAFLAFVLGFMFWILDAAQVYCTDVGLLNGRAIFHYTNAITLYLLFRFYRSQDD